MALRSPQTATYAKPELVKAGSTLRDAEAAFDRDDETGEVNHLAVMTEKQIDLARSRASERAENAEAKALNQERDQMVATAERQRTELETQLAELEARETERGLVVTLGDVLFETDKAELRPSARGKLRQLVEVMRASPDRAVLVEGHADARGSSDHNLDLSQRRAQAVRAYFTASGVDPDRIVATGYGEGYPVASNGTVEGQTMNRRVEVVLLNPGARPELSKLILH
jgi:outer membrane protein OmpA-like peptidoglycan-associated protein